MGDADRKVVPIPAGGTEDKVPKEHIGVRTKKLTYTISKNDKESNGTKIPTLGSKVLQHNKEKGTSSTDPKVKCVLQSQPRESLGAMLSTEEHIPKEPKKISITKKGSFNIDSISSGGLGKEGYFGRESPISELSKEEYFGRDTISSGGLGKGGSSGKYYKSGEEDSFGKDYSKGKESYFGKDHKNGNVCQLAFGRSYKRSKKDSVGKGYKISELGKKDFPTTLSKVDPSQRIFEKSSKCQNELKPNVFGVINHPQTRAGKKKGKELLTKVSDVEQETSCLTTSKDSEIITDKDTMKYFADLQLVKEESFGRDTISSGGLGEGGSSSKDYKSGKEDSFGKGHRRGKGNYFGNDHKSDKVGQLAFGKSYKRSEENSVSKGSGKIDKKAFPRRMSEEESVIKGNKSSEPCKKTVPTSLSKEDGIGKGCKSSKLGKKALPTTLRKVDSGRNFFEKSSKCEYELKPNVFGVSSHPQTKAEKKILTPISDVEQETLHLTTSCDSEEAEDITYEDIKKYFAYLQEHFVEDEVAESREGCDAVGDFSVDYDSEEARNGGEIVFRSNKLTVNPEKDTELEEPAVELELSLDEILREEETKKLTGSVNPEKQ